MNHSSSATAESFGMGSEGAASHGQHGHKGCSTGGRRKWSGLEIATMVGGFIAFWPAGLVALGVKLVKGEMWPGSKENVMPWTAWKNAREERGGKPFTFTSGSWGSAASWSMNSASGNTAFDAYRKTQLERLEAERRKLDEEQKAFSDYMAKLHRAKDQEEFDRFMAERNTPQSQ